MKKYILSISILVVLLMGSTLFLPYLFKDKIIELVKTEANNGLKPKLDFAPNIGINIFKSFPNLNLTLNDVSLIHQDSAFSNDTFMSAKKLEVSFDLMKFYKEQQYIFRSIAITQPLLHLETNSDQRVNWDIMKDTSNEEVSSEALNFELAEVDITNGRFEYIDDGISLKILGLDHHSNGNFNTETFTLSTLTAAREVKLISGGIAYLNKWEVKQKGDIEIDLANDKYSLPNNSLVINGLPASLDGSLAISGDYILFDFETNSTTEDLNKFLTLVPAIYTSDYANMKTEGTGKMSASFKGKYGENSFPAYDLKLVVDDGWFKYPELPLPAEDINLNLHVFSTSGNTDHTVIDIPKLHFKLADAPFDATINMQDLFGNSRIEATAEGRIDLANLLKLVPLKGTQLTGLIASNIEIKGRLNDISNSAIDKFKASGNIKTTNLIYQTQDMNEQLVVNNAKIGVYNQKIAISSFDGMLGKNDINFSGTFDNFFSYLLKDETLTGKATLTSNNLNANNFLEEDETIVDDSEVQMTLIEIPGNVDLDLSTSIKNLKYDDLELTDLVGEFGVKNKTLTMKDISTHLLGGRVNLTGNYTYDAIKPRAQFDVSYSDIKVTDLLSKFTVVKAFAPFAKEIKAITTAKIQFSSDLNEDMSPKLSNINLGGSLNLENIEMGKLKVLKSIDSKLGTGHFNIKTLKDLLLNFSIQDGKLFVSPFELFIDSSKLSLNGLSKLDGSINYTGLLSIPSTYVKNETSILNNLTEGTQFNNLQFNPKDFLDIDIDISGTFNNPEVKLNLKEIKQSLKQSVKEGVVTEVKNKKEDVKSTTTTELNKLKDETQKKADEAKANLQKELAKKKKEAEDKLKQEAKDRKKKLEDEAAKKLKGLFDK